MPKNDTMSKAEKPLLIVLSIISLGLLIAIVYVWYNALSTRNQTPPNQGMLTPPTQETSPQSSPSASNPSTEAMTLTINTPQAQDVVASPTLKVEGVTSPGASVALMDSSDETIVSADASGSFSTAIGLDMGENQITVTAFDTKGTQTAKVLNVAYMP